MWLLHVHIKVWLDGRNTHTESILFWKMIFWVLGFFKGDVDSGIANTVWTIPSGLVDGAYEITLDVTCLAPSSGVITGSNSFQSAPVSGLIDRSAPLVVFRSPKNGAPYIFDDTISLLFNERINCELPYTFTATLKLPNRILKDDDLSVFCTTSHEISIDILTSSGVDVCLDAQNLLSWQIRDSVTSWLTFVVVNK